MEFPSLLDMNTPEVYAYSVYSVIAEKFEAIVSLGNANSIKENEEYPFRWDHKKTEWRRELE